MALSDEERCELTAWLTDLTIRMEDLGPMPRSLV